MEKDTTLTEEQQRRRAWAEKWLVKAAKSSPQKRARLLEVARGDQEHLLVLAALFPQINAYLEGNIPPRDIFPHLERWCTEPAFLGVTLREIVRWVNALGEEIFFTEPRWVQQHYAYFGDRERKRHFLDLGVAPEAVEYVLLDCRLCPDTHLPEDAWYLLDVLCFLDDEGLVETAEDFTAVVSMFKAWCRERNNPHGKTKHYRLLVLDWWRAIRRTLPPKDLAVLTERSWMTWLQHGFTPQEAVTWIKAGFFAGYAPAVRAWKEHGFTPEEARQWLDEGWPYNGARKAKALADKYAPLGYTVQDMIASQRLVDSFSGRERRAEHDYTL